MESSQPKNSATWSVYRVWCHPVGISVSAHFGGRRQRVYALVMTKNDGALVTCVRGPRQVETPRAYVKAPFALLVTHITCLLVPAVHSLSCRFFRSASFWPVEQRVWILSILCGIFSVKQNSGLRASVSWFPL